MGRLFRLLASVLAIGLGLITLAGQVIVGQNLFTASADLLVEITAIIVAISLLIGILNLFLVHTRRILTLRRGFLYSLALVISAGLVIYLWLTGDAAGSSTVLEDIQLSVESALAALVLFALVYGAYRMLRKRVTWAGVLFILAVLVMLIGALPLEEAGAITQVRAWLLAVPVSAGARGILLGVALATLIVGVRVLVGQDLTYRE